MSEHDIFKVETVGDTYMVVSGLPEAQADHTSRVAAFAAEVLRVSRTVRVSLTDE